MEDLFKRQFSIINERSLTENEAPQHESSVINPDTGFLSDDLVNRKSHTPLPMSMRIRETSNAMKKRKKVSKPLPEDREIFPPPPPSSSSSNDTNSVPPEFSILETFPPKSPVVSQEVPHMFSDEFQTNHTPKKRGRPPSTPNTPEKSEPVNSKNKKFAPDLKSRRIKQINEYVKLYPEIANELPYRWDSALDDKHLDDIYYRCRIRATEGMEFDMVCKVFYTVIGNIEDATRLLIHFGLLSPQVPFVSTLAGLPPGSVQKFIEYGIQTQHPDSGYLELREIAIDWLGYFPTNPYVRLVIKTAYRMYDFIAFENDQHLKNIKGNMKRASREKGPIPQDLQEKLNRNPLL